MQPTYLIKHWQGLRQAIEAGPRGPVFRWSWVLVPLGLLLVLTAGILLLDFDFRAQKAIYVAGGDSWDFGERGVWRILYDFGTLPAGLLSAFALFGFIYGSFREKWRRWRRCFLFIILLGALGPGVVTNLLLKEYWGRPRPRAVEGLGGHHRFEPVLSIDRSSSGKSFPCGHATMGFFFFGGFFLFRRYRRDWAWFFLLSSLCLGWFIGVARVCQGGHFFSDIIWAGAVIYFVAMGLYYALGLHRGIVREPTNRKMPLWMKIAVPAAGLSMIAGVLLATPYREKRDWRILSDQGKIQPLDIVLILKAGYIEVLPGESYAVTGEAWGHGVPTSKVGVHFLELERNGRTLVVYKENMSGRFTELNQELDVSLPWDRVETVRLEPDDCEVILQVPAPGTAPRKILVRRGNGSITLELGGNEIGWSDASARDRFGLPTDPVRSGPFQVEVRDDFEGSIRCVRSE